MILHQSVPFYMKMRTLAAYGFMFVYANRELNSTEQGKREGDS